MATMVLDRMVPEQTFEQRMAALEKANVIRCYRAGVKRDVKAGRKRAVDLLLADDERLDTMKVVDLMLAAPKFGRVKVNRILARNRISPSKTVGGLSERQRLELAAYLR